MKVFAPFWCSILLVITPVAHCFAVEPLTRAHAHNDYQHSRPLLDALDHGFCSVEADVFLVDGQLLVGHELTHTAPDRTLQRLYLAPLYERVRQNGGRVFKDGPTVTLLIDFKIDEKTIGRDPSKVAEQSERTYSALKKLLQPYRSMLTRFNEMNVTTNAISVLLTGARPPSVFNEKGERFVAVDGHLGNLESGMPSSVVPLVSDKWSQFFKWNGNGDFQTEERANLTRFVQKAHSQGRRIRFWGVPDKPVVWRELFDSGVDLINTDDLAGLQKFLRGMTQTAGSFSRKQP